MRYALGVLDELDQDPEAQDGPKIARSRLDALDSRHFHGPGLQEMILEQFVAEVAYKDSKII